MKSKKVKLSDTFKKKLDGTRIAVDCACRVADETKRQAIALIASARKGKIDEETFDRGLVMASMRGRQNLNDYISIETDKKFREVK